MVSDVYDIVSRSFFDKRQHGRLRPDASALGQSSFPISPEPLEPVFGEASDSQLQETSVVHTEELVPLRQTLAYASGFDDGFTEGFGKGYGAGYSAGFADGFSAGYWAAKTGR